MRNLFPTRWQNDKPPSLEEFMDMFPDDAACAAHVAKSRWPNGFICPKCGSSRAGQLKCRLGTFQCKDCKRQTSVIAGTIMHRTHIPLRKWFLAAYFVATHSNGISALQLQPKLGLGSYGSAWLLMSKLRSVMVNPEREPLSGEVEVDETLMPHRNPDNPRSDGHLVVAGAVEKTECGRTGRIRLESVESRSRQDLNPFVLKNTEEGSTIVTDALPSYGELEKRKHLVRNLSEKGALPAHLELPGIHRVFANLKRFGLGVYHGFRDKHLNSYLDEFVFRWNRRRCFQSSMDTLITLGVKHKPLTYRQIVGDTLDWKKTHRAQIYRMVGKEKLEWAKAKAQVLGKDVLEVLSMYPKENQSSQRKRAKARRPVLGQAKGRNGYWQLETLIA